MIKNSLTEQRDTILRAVLPGVVFDGWRWRDIEKAAAENFGEAQVARAVFPGGLVDVLDHFSDLADRQMMERLSEIKPEEMRVRDRIRTAILERFAVLAPHREAVRAASGYWLVPARSLRAGRCVWRTADQIWQWAGDKSTDYNHYTKRGLLSSILVASTLAWLDDESASMDSTKAFVDRRIENVMQLGRSIGKIKPTHV